MGVAFMTNIINIDGISYELSDNYLDVSNIENFVISQDNIITDTYTVNKMEFYKFVSVSGNSNLKYIQDSKNNNVAIYNTQTNEIISVGEDNRINLNDCMQLSQQSGLYNYYNLQENNILDTSDIDSILIQDNNIIIDNETYNLIPIVEGGYFIRDTNGNNVAIYRPLTQQIISAGTDNSVNLNNFTVYDGRYINISTDNALSTSSINSVVLDTQNQTININVNTDSGTQNLECTLTALYTDENTGNTVYAIKDSIGKTIALYDSNTNQIISSGQDNSIHLAQALDNNYYPLTGTPINTSNVNYVALNLEGENKTINLNITNGDTTENLQCTLEELYTDDEGNIVYAIKDNTEKTIALYDIQNGKLSSSGENNFTHLAQAPNNYYYYPLTGTPLNTSDINYVYIDFNDIEINITNGDTTQNIKYNIVTYIDENTGETVCTIQDNTGKTIALYDSNTNQIISSGQDNYVDLDNFMSYDDIKRIKISTDNALDTSNINYVNLDIDNKKIYIDNSEYNLAALYDDNKGNTVYAIKDNEQNIIAIYDSSTNKIVSSGQDNSISLNESFAMSNNQYFKLTGTPLEIDIGMHITLDFNNDRITVEDTSYDLIPLYSENEKTYIYGVQNSDNEIIAMYDIQNGKFVSSSNNSTYLIQTSDNDYYSLIHAPLTISDINYVSLDFNNSFIEINSGIENTRYELVPYITPSGVRIPYLCVKNSSDEFFALYDIQNGKLFSSGENNFAHLAQAPDNNYYLLTGTPLETSSINYVVLDTQSQTININVNTETATQNISCTLEELYTDSSGNIVYTIQDNTGKTIAIYDSNTNQIISSGQDNYVDLDNFMSYDGRHINISADNALSTSSINYVNLDIDNEKIYIDSLEYNLAALYTDDEGNIVYAIKDNTGKTIALYDSNTNQIISSGQENSVDLDNFMFYDGRYINISADNALDTSNINSIYVDSTNNKIIINGTQPYDIEQMKDDSGNNIDMWAVKDLSGNIIAVYDNSGNSPTIFAGQDNFVNLDESFRLTDALLDTSSINSVALDIQNQTININVDTETGTQNLECTLTALYTDDEGNIVYAIKDSTEKTIALYDTQNGKISSSGENNFTHLAQAPDNNYYPLTGTPLDTSTINSVALDTQNQTININVNTETGTQNIPCTLTTLYTDDEGNIVYAIKDSTEKTIALYDIQNGKLSSSGENNFTHLAQAPDNNYYPLTDTPLDVSSINFVTLDTQNKTIDINITVKGVGTPTLNCTLEQLYIDRNTGNAVYAIKNDEQNIIAIYDSNTSQIISAGQDNSISLNESFAMSNNQYFKLTGTPLETSDINSVTLNIRDRIININVNTETGTQNEIYDLIALYNDKEGNTVYGIRDNERNFIAIYDSNTKKIISSGQENSVDLDDFISQGNGIYNKPETNDLFGPQSNLSFAVVRPRDPSSFVVASQMHSNSHNSTTSEKVNNNENKLMAEDYIEANNENILQNSSSQTNSEGDNSFDVSQITNIKSATYSVTNKEITITDQNNIEHTFTIEKYIYDNPKFYYQILDTNNEEIGKFNLEYFQIELGDNNYQFIPFINTKTDEVTIMIRPEDLYENAKNIVCDNSNIIFINKNNDRNIAALSITNNLNDDGSYDLTVNGNGDVPIVGTYNSNTMEIMIYHDNSINYDIYKDINGIFYKLSDSYLEKDEINTVIINEDKIIINDTTYELVPYSQENNTMYYIQDENGNNVGIYNIETNEIISATQDNTLNLDDLIQANDGTYLNPNLLQGDSVQVQINESDSTALITLANGKTYIFDAVDQNGDGIYILKENNGEQFATYNTLNNQFKLDTIYQDNIDISVAFDKNNNYILLQDLQIQSGSFSIEDVENNSGIITLLDINNNEYSFDIAYNTETGKYDIIDNQNNIFATFDVLTGEVSINTQTDSQKLLLDENGNFISQNYLQPKTLNIEPSTVEGENDKILMTNIDGKKYTFEVIKDTDNSDVYMIQDAGGNLIGTFDSKTGELYIGDNESPLSTFMKSNNGTYVDTSKLDVKDLNYDLEKGTLSIIDKDGSNFEFKIESNNENDIYTIIDANGNTVGKFTPGDVESTLDLTDSGGKSFKVETLSEENKDIFNTIFENNEELSNYLLKGDYKGLKEALNKELEELLKTTNPELLQKTQKVVNDIDLDNVKTKEEFLGALNKSLDDNGFDSVEDIKILPSIEDILSNPAIIATYSVASIILAALLRMLLKQILEKKEEEKENEKNKDFDVNAKSNSTKKNAKHTISSPDELLNAESNDKEIKK